MNNEKSKRPDEEGSEKDWVVLDFSRKPGLKFGVQHHQVYDLLEAMRESRLQTVEQYRSFLKRDKVRKYLDKMPPDAKVKFLFDVTFYPYINGNVGIADMVMEEMGLDETQQKVFSKTLAIEAMDGLSDPDGLRIYTFDEVAARVLRFYPDLKTDPEMVLAAKSAFLTELEEARDEKDFKKALVYAEMGFFELAEVKTDPYLIGRVTHRLLSCLKSRDVDIAIKIAKDFMSDETLAANQEQIEEVAETGFRYIFGHMAEDDRLLAETFLPKDFLARPEIIKFIRDAFEEKMEKGYLSGCVGINSFFGECLPKNFRDFRIWKTQLALSAKMALFEAIKEGHGDDVVEFIDVFGTPRDFFEDERFGLAVIEGLRSGIKWSSQSERAMKLTEVFSLGDEIWKQVFSCDYLLALFYGTSEHADLSKLADFIGKYPEIGSLVDEREVANFVTVLAEAGKPLDSDMLDQFGRLTEALPQAKEYLDVPAGGEWPQNATIKDLLELCTDSGLMRNALEGSYAFKIDEAKELAKLLNEKENSNGAVTFLNILKRTDLMTRISDEEKSELMRWVREIAAEARAAKVHSKDREYAQILKAHYNRYARGIVNQTDVECLSMLYRHRADVLALALVIMNDPSKIRVIGEFVLKMDPNKAFLMTEKELTRVLKSRFPDLWFPGLR